MKTIILNIVFVDFNDVISKNLRKYFNKFIRDHKRDSLKFIHQILDIKNLDDSIDMGEPIFIFNKDMDIKHISKFIKKYENFSYVILNKKTFKKLEKKNLKYDIQFFSSVIEYLKVVGVEINNIMEDKK